MTKRRVVIVDSVRTGMCKAHRGSLNNTRPDDLLGHCISHLVKRNDLDPALIGDVVIGCAFPEGPQGNNIARIASIIAGIPVTTPAVTVNRFCSSGSQAISLAASEILLHELDIAIAGGVETISLIRDGNFNGKHLRNPRLMETFPHIYMSMGETAENVADHYSIRREEQDEFALRSQKRTAEAQDAGLPSEEIVPMQVRRLVSQPGTTELLEQDWLVDKDEANRSTTTIAGLASLPPAFREGGSVTAGNSSQLTDGASATLLMSEQRAEDLGLEPLGYFLGSAATGCDPAEMGIGPVSAIPRLLERFALTTDDIDVIELNEAFASQVLAIAKILRLPFEK